MTPERKIFNEEILPKFINEYVKENDVVVDIGKPNDGWGYKQLFSKATYQTLDRHDWLQPDIVMDLECIDKHQLFKGYADCAVAMGVWEQCDNPFKLYDGILALLKPKGYALLGIMLTGFPLIQDLDLHRFTEQGVFKLLRDCKIEHLKICNRDGIPSYAFAIVRNVPPYTE